MKQLTFFLLLLIAVSNISAQDNYNAGLRSFMSNTYGNNNTTVGVDALSANTTGSFNTAVGAKALWFNKTGGNNTALGQATLLYSNGSHNVAVGAGALAANTTASQNTAIGSSALGKNKTGYGNTAVGESALEKVTAGKFNTAIGHLADVGSEYLSNTTTIGYQAKVNGNNSIRIGNTSVAKIEGQVAFSFPSDARFKYNIQKNVPGLDFITRLTPVTYYFDEQKLAHYNNTGIIDNSNIRQAAYDENKQLHTGFLAQDVERIAKELGYRFDGLHAPVNDKDHYSLAYSQFIMPLVKAVQEQQQIIEKQQKHIESLEKRLLLLEEKMK